MTKRITFVHYFDLSYLAPLLVAILIPFNLLITYLWAVFMAHTAQPFLPTISQTYTDPPQAVWFGLIFNLISLMILLRFIEIKTILTSEKYAYLLNLSDQSRDRVMFWNKLSVLLALIVSGSTSLVASVRISELYYIHIYTSLIAFTSGPTLYLIQTCITLRLAPIVTSLSLAYVRLGLTVLMITAGLVFGFTQFMPEWHFFYEWMGNEFGTDPGQVQQVLQAASEYILVLLISPYFLTYIPEIRRLKCIKSAQFEYIFK